MHKERASKALLLLKALDSLWKWEMFADARYADA